MSYTESKAVRKLIKSSNNGDFSASYQLSKIYAEGDGVKEKSSSEAQKYKEICATQLEINSLRLKEIKLENFKGFGDICIEFSESSNTTILVGNNGSGKSTVLDAIKKCLTHLTSRLSTRSKNGDQIEQVEIKSNSSYSLIKPIFKFQDLLFSMELTQVSAITDREIKSKYTELNELGEIFKAANTAIPHTAFPLLACYAVERANDVTTKDIADSDEVKNDHFWDKSRAYNKSLTGKADFKLFFKWIKDSIETQAHENSEVNLLKSQIKSKKAELNNPLLKKLLLENSESATSIALIKNHEAELEALNNELNSYYDIKSKTLSVVENAIYRFLPGFSDLKLQREPLDLTVNKNGTELSILQLSQGEKTILALVADISRRLTMLNPSKENPLEGTGIVLIDEIDLHLHPSWQQKIIQRLENTFPYIQFIITTHSPQVCHTIDSAGIWLLKDGKKQGAPKGTRGAVSSWVLKNLFEVEERPPEDIFTKKLFCYVDLVYEDKYDDVKALELRRELSKHFGSAYKDLVELDLYIENKRWEKEYEED